LGFSWVLAKTSEEISHFVGIDQTITTIPEIKQIENLSTFCNKNKRELRNAIANPLNLKDIKGLLCHILSSEIDPNDLITCVSVEQH